MTTTGEATASKILEAGRQLIMRRGYSGFSYADIADAISIRKASIHHHFPSKTDLVIEVVKQSRTLFSADMASLQASGADSLAQLHAYVAYWERCITDDTAPFCVAGMLGAERPSLPEDIACEVKIHFEHITSWVETVLTKGSKAGLFKLGISAAEDATWVVATVYGAMLVARAQNNASLFKTATDGVLSRMVRAHRRT